MSKTTTPKYRVEMSFIHYGNKRREIAHFAWERSYGKPTPENAKKFRDGMNKSFQTGEPNEHLRNGQSDYSKATIVEQKTGLTVAEYNPPMFEIVN